MLRQTGSGEHAQRLQMVRLIEGKDPGWRKSSAESDSDTLTIQSLQSGWRMIQKFTAATLIQHITDMKFWKECACQHSNNVRVDLRFRIWTMSRYFDRMRKDLPECDSRKMYIYDGKTPRKERD